MIAWIAALSVAAFVASLIAIPWILVRLPANYFDARIERRWLHGRHPVLRTVAHVLKNIVGVVFLLAGIAMLVLPGQGALTMLIGVTLLDFPGKRKLEARFIRQPLILKTVNSIRQRFGREPLILAPD